jgi:hypothetical protein
MSHLIAHCPVCGFGPFPEPYISVQEIRYSFDICDCCGCEYGYSDNERHFNNWVAAECPWSNPRAKPAHWSLATQINHIIRPWPPHSGFILNEAARGSG